MKKILIGLAVVLVLLGAAFVFAGPKQAAVEVSTTPTTTPEAAPTEVAVTEGTYRVDPAESTFEWAAKKPLIEGYIDSGSIGITDGTVNVGTSTADGVFSLDMNTLKVGLTAKKPGQEEALEKHLKSADFFDVAKYPTASFTIKSVTPATTTTAALTYVITGDLMMKGKKNSISFPAKIYLAGDVLHAEAATEIDRTKWGITYGSGNFFKSLGDNLIDDMVAISFSVVAPKVQ